MGPERRPDPNQLIIRINPLPGARIRFVAKAAGEEDFEPADLDVLFEKTPGSDPEPYERLLGDALAGNRQLFTPEDSVEQAWRIVQPLLDEPGEVATYEQGTWGPTDANRLVRGICEWYDPWMP